MSNERYEFVVMVRANSRFHTFSIVDIFFQAISIRIAQSKHIISTNYKTQY